MFDFMYRKSSNIFIYPLYEYFFRGDVGFDEFIYLIYSISIYFLSYFGSSKLGCSKESFIENL